MPRQNIVNVYTVKEQKCLTLSNSLCLGNVFFHSVSKLNLVAKKKIFTLEFKVYTVTGTFFLNEKHCSK